jgi:hypothetical protein
MRKKRTLRRMMWMTAGRGNSFKGRAFSFAGCRTGRRGDFYRNDLRTDFTGAGCGAEKANG